MDRLRADAHSVMVALEFHVFAGAAHTQLAIRTELLRPVARHAAANGEYAQPGLLQEGLSKIVQIEERIVTELRLALASAHAVGKGHIQAQFGISERRHKNRNVPFKSRLQDSPPFGMTFQVLANGPVQLPRTPDLLPVPLARHLFHGPP